RGRRLARSPLRPDGHTGRTHTGQELDRGLEQPQLRPSSTTLLNRLEIETRRVPHARARLETQHRPSLLTNCGRGPALVLMHSSTNQARARCRGGGVLGTTPHAIALLGRQAVGALATIKL